MGFTDLNKQKKIGGSDTVYVEGPTSTFGDLQVTTVTPQAQGDFIYGINNQIFTTSSFAGAAVAVVDRICELESGTNPAGSATVQLRRGLKYRPGQGSMMRATALFAEPDAGNAQFIGAGTAECGYFIGYFGTSFGILHSQDGQRETRKLDITTGAGTGNVTVTLDGDSVVVPVVGGSDKAQTAYQLALADYSQVGNGGWLADAISGSVYFVAARSNATSTGSYSVAGSSIAGTFTQVSAGEAQTNTFIPSGSFNLDKLDGFGPSGIDLDPQKGNVFQIGFQYLGFGNATFGVEDPNTGRIRDIHVIKNANSRTTPVLKNPNVSVLATSANIGGTTSKKLKTASMAGFIEGEVRNLDPKFTETFSFSGVNEQEYVPLALLKLNRVFNGESCFGEIDILRSGASNQANNQTLTVAFFKRAEVSGVVDFKYVDQENSVVSYSSLDPNTQTITNLSEITPFFSFVVGSASSESIDITDLAFTLSIGDSLLIAIKTTASITGEVNLNWFEQQ